MYLLMIIDKVEMEMRRCQYCNLKKIEVRILLINKYIHYTLNFGKKFSTHPGIEQNITLFTKMVRKYPSFPFVIIRFKPTITYSSSKDISQFSVTMNNGVIISRLATCYPMKIEDTINFHSWSIEFIGSEHGSLIVKTKFSQEKNIAGRESIYI